MPALFDNMPTGETLAMLRRHNRPPDKGEKDLAAMRMTSNG
jgi:hypothetical protein